MWSLIKKKKTHRKKGIRFVVTRGGIRTKEEEEFEKGDQKAQASSHKINTSTK